MTRITTPIHCILSFNMFKCLYLKQQNTFEEVLNRIVVSINFLLFYLIVFPH